MYLLRRVDIAMEELAAVTVGTTQKAGVHLLCQMCIWAVAHVHRFSAPRFISEIIKDFGNPYKSTA